MSKWLCITAPNCDACCGSDPYALMIILLWYSINSAAQHLVWKGKAECNLSKVVTPEDHENDSRSSQDLIGDSQNDIDVSNEVGYVTSQNIHVE